jgi:putative hydrolase of the HAD superfamily
VISADEVGHEKPSPEFFAYLTARVGGGPESVVFVGDNPRTDIVGAGAAGLRSIHFRRGSYARFDLTSIPKCEPTWSIDYLTQIEPLLTE